MSLSKSNVTLTVGKNTTLTVNNPMQAVTWSSSKKSVAKITSTNGAANEKATVSALKSGQATVTANIGGVKLKTKVKVTAPKISRSSVNINEGKSVTLTVTKLSQKAVWKSSKPSVAKVTSQSGKYKQKAKVGGIKKGKAKITAKVGGNTLTCNVTVKHVHSWKAATCT